MNEPSQHAIDCWKAIQAYLQDRFPVTVPIVSIQQAIDEATGNLRAFIAEQDSVIQEQTNRADRAEAACAAWRTFANAVKLSHDLDVEDEVWAELYSPDCGRNHVPMDDVRPLLEQNEAGCFCHHCGPIKDFLAKHGDALTAPARSC